MHTTYLGKSAGQVWKSINFRIVEAMILIAVAVLQTPLHSASFTWDGGGANAYWSTAANWVGDAAPGVTDDIVFGTAFTSGNPNLNGANITINSLSFTGSAAITLASGGTFTLTSGIINKSNTGIAYLYPNIVLGADGVFTNSTSSGSNALRFYGAISDAGVSRSVTLTGGGTFYFYGASTYSGGTVLNGSSAYLYNDNAFGSGAVTVKGSSALYFNASVSNDIVYSNITSNSILYSTTIPSGAVSKYYTNLGNISGDMGGYALYVRGSVGYTWTFSGVNLTGLSSGGLYLLAETAGNYSTYVFSSTPTINGASNGRIQIGSISGSAATGGGANLLVSAAGNFNNSRIDISDGGEMDTVGGIHASGTVDYSATIYMNDKSAGAVNFASLNSGAVTKFSGNIQDSSSNSSVKVKINASYKQVDLTASVGQSAPINKTTNPLGVVVFGGSNTYTAGTDVVAGTFLVTNTSGSATGTGSVTVYGGATFGGTGIVTPTGTNGITMQSGSVLAPGELGVGTLHLNGASTTGPLLTMASGSSFQIELGAPGTSDSVEFLNYTVGDLVLNNTTVNFTNAGGLAAGSYKIFKFYSDSGSTAVSSGLADGLVIGTGLESYSTSYFDYASDGIYLVVAIPEASTAAMLVVGLIGLLVAARYKWMDACKEQESCLS